MGDNDYTRHLFRLTFILASVRSDVCGYVFVFLGRPIFEIDRFNWPQLMNRITITTLRTWLQCILSASLLELWVVCVCLCFGFISIDFASVNVVYRDLWIFVHLTIFNVRTKPEWNEAKMQRQSGQAKKKNTQHISKQNTR